MFFEHISKAIAATSLSQYLKDQALIIPTVQTVHILSIAVVMSSILMTDLRLFGVVGRTEPVGVVARRFLTWMWWALLVLLISGSILVTAEPDRDLTNTVFKAKMLLVLLAAAITLTIQLPLRRDDGFWTKSPKHALGGKLIASASLVVWVAIVFCGRWIAYTAYSQFSN